MRLIKKNIDRMNGGEIKLEPQEQEDMWHAYNLIAIDDSLRASTVRKIVQTSDTGSATTSRRRMMLTISVLSVEYDSSACALRVKGRTIEENEFVKRGSSMLFEFIFALLMKTIPMNEFRFKLFNNCFSNTSLISGSHHTLDLELHNAFSLRKHEWDSIALDRVEMACNPAHQADLAAVIMHEGLANICLITQHLTITRQKIEHTIPRKRKGLCSQHDKGLEKFFDTIIAAIIKHIDFAIVKAVIVASPGFLKDQFFEYMMMKATRENERHLIENRSRFILLHASNGFKHALTEVLQDPLIANRLSDTKAAGEVKALDDFMQLLNEEPEKAYYGLEVVERANQHQAIERKIFSSEKKQ